MNQNMEEIMKENSNFAIHNHQVQAPQFIGGKKGAEQTLSIDNSFVKSSMNKSYERLLAETLEAQNTMLSGYQQHMQFQVGSQGHQTSTNKHHTKNSQSIQFKSGSKRATVSANVSQTRLQGPSGAEYYEPRSTNAHHSNQHSKSNNSSHKSLTCKSLIP